MPLNLDKDLRKLLFCAFWTVFRAVFSCRNSLHVFLFFWNMGQNFVIWSSFCMLCRVKDLIFESIFSCKGSFCSIISCKSCRSSAFFKSIIQVPFRAASQVCPSSQTNMSLTSTKEVLMRDIQGIILVPFSNGFPKGTPSFFVWIFLCVFLPISV